MNWKNTVSKINTKHYSFPAGWDTRETIAEQLECSTDRVDTLLGPGLKSGEIEKQQFPVWDERLNRKTLVFGYRAVKKPQERKEEDGGVDDIILDLARRHPGRPASYLRDRLPKALRSEVTSAYISCVIAG